MSRAKATAFAWAATAVLASPPGFCPEPWNECLPGREVCGEPFANAPIYHLMDQNGCGENDPNGPVFDPVHGVIHHFYQDHLSANGQQGPIYGHFVSKDFVHWAQMPVAIWNGLDTSVWPPRATPYDNRGIWTGSAVVVDGAGPGGKGPGVVNIYPGACNKKEWPDCADDNNLNQAVPADYAGDPLLTNWTKPSYNPIVNSTERDPSTPWRTPHGEWRMRTYNAMLYGAASDADLVAGKWYTIGVSQDMRVGECPSFFPLPGPTPGFEAAYRAAEVAGKLPTHVHKTSFQGDFWQLGSYDPGARNTTGVWSCTPGWEDVFMQRSFDVGYFYACKDAEYPTKDGKKRRINWGWATVPPNSTQTLPRVITFNAAARTLEQAPIEELEALRGPPAASRSALFLAPGVAEELSVGRGVAKYSETVAVFKLPREKATFGVRVGAMECKVSYSPSTDRDSSKAFYEVPVQCGDPSGECTARTQWCRKDTLRIVHGEDTVEVRVFVDATFVEAYFQKGRVAITQVAKFDDDSKVALFSSGAMAVPDASVYPMSGIWVTPEAVRGAPRVYQAAASAAPEEAVAEEVLV